MEEWKDRSSRFEKSLKKTEEKLKEQISIGREVPSELCVHFRQSLVRSFRKSFCCFTSSNGFQTVLISIGVVDKYIAIFQGYKG